MGHFKDMCEDIIDEDFKSASKSVATAAKKVGQSVAGAAKKVGSAVAGAAKKAVTSKPQVTRPSVDHEKLYGKTRVDNLMKKYRGHLPSPSDKSTQQHTQKKTTKADLDQLSRDIDSGKGVEL